MTTMIRPEVLSPAPQRRRRRGRLERPTVGTALRVLILVGFAVFCLAPLVWLVLAPTKTGGQLLLDPPYAFGTLERVVEAWLNLGTYNDGVIYQWMINSVYYTMVPVVISVITALLAGYALATLSFPGRKAVLLATLISMVLPGTAVVLPLFLEMHAFGFVNTAAAVILPASFYPFGVYLCFIYFATSLPKELLEAAKVDGSGAVRTFVSIALPLAKPIIALAAFFSFIAHWNNYFLPYVMLASESKYNLPVGLGTLMASTNAISPTSGSLLPIGPPEAALAGLIVIVPVALLFVFFQRYLVGGILSGGTKG